MRRAVFAYWKVISTDEVPFLTMYDFWVAS